MDRLISELVTANHALNSAADQASSYIEYVSEELKAKGVTRLPLVALGNVANAWRLDFDSDTFRFVGGDSDPVPVASLSREFRIWVAAQLPDALRWWARYLRDARTATK